MERREVLEYHELSKHHFQRYAPGPPALAWAHQPDPFRRYHGAARVTLAGKQAVLPPEAAGRILDPERRVEALDAATLGRLLRDSLGLSARKSFQGSRWSLRINPSSGNLHPTEAYYLGPPVEGLFGRPVLAHYRADVHALEVRAELGTADWEMLRALVPGARCYVGFTSILWREAWKYGERAYRYCQHDLGHALGALGFAAALQGWRLRVADHLSRAQLEGLLGGEGDGSSEPEEAECLVAVLPQDREDEPCVPLARAPAITLQGVAGRLSREWAHWPHAEAMARGLQKPPTQIAPPRSAARTFRGEQLDGPPLRRLIHQRRSAVSFRPPDRDLPLADFLECLRATLPAAQPGLFSMWPYPPAVSLVLFVHRVEGCSPGVYLLIRAPRLEPLWRKETRAGLRFEAAAPDAADVPLYRLIEGECRSAARSFACHQDIAADGFFSLAMVSAFDGPLDENGGWFYPRLFWECGLIGQVLYLEAERLGVRGTGIGCFFDDPVHDLLGLRGHRLQDLYHFTIGEPVEDTRLETGPPYPVESG